MMSKRQAVLAAIDDIECSLRRLSRMGWKGFDCSQPCLETLENWGTAPVTKGVKYDETLEDIRHDLGDCLRCKLSAGRKNIVFGSGSPRARLVFVG